VRPPTCRSNPKVGALLKRSTALAASISAPYSCHRRVWPFSGSDVPLSASKNSFQMQCIRYAGCRSAVALGARLAG
jgi:hypothetical protein